MTRSITLAIFIVALMTPQAVHCQAPATITTKIVNGIEIQVGGPTDDTEDIIAWKILKQRGRSSREELREQAIIDLKGRGQSLFDFQRVEVDGVRTTDNTSDKIPEMFDRQFKLSYMNEPTTMSGKIRQTVTDGLNWVKDVKSAALGLGGEPTAHEKESLAGLASTENTTPKRVNDLIAHSWGSEAVYKAILSGYIYPPRRLIVIGVPEENEEQWRMLAKYTGIEVHVIGFATDKAQIGGNAVSHATGFSKDPAELAKLWEKWCAKRGALGCADPQRFDSRKFDYDVNVPPLHGADIMFDKLHVLQFSLDHDRLDYFTYLARRNLLNKTVAELAAPQEKLIDAEMSKDLSEAMSEAAVLIAKARELAQQDSQARSKPDGEKTVANDDALRQALADIAIRGCSNDETLSQEDFDTLPTPIDHDFFLSKKPKKLAGNKCADGLYINLALMISGGNKPTLASIRSAVSPPAAAGAYTPPSLAARAYTPPSMAQIAFDYDGNWSAVKDAAISTCNGGSLSPRSLQAIRDIGKATNRNDYQTFSSQDEGLSGCAAKIYDAIAGNIGANEFNDSISDQSISNLIAGWASAYDKPPSLQPTPSQNPTPNKARGCIWVTVSLSGRKECW